MQVWWSGFNLIESEWIVWNLADGTFEKKTIALRRRIIGTNSPKNFVFESSVLTVTFSNENHWQILCRRGVLLNTLGKLCIIWWRNISNGLTSNYENINIWSTLEFSPNLLAIRSYQKRLPDTSRFGFIVTSIIGGNCNFSDNHGQKTRDKSQNCTTSVFDCVPPAPPVSMLLESNAIRPSQHWIRGKGGLEAPKRMFRLDILGNITKTPKFACVPALFDHDCQKMVVNR